MRKRFDLLTLELFVAVAAAKSIAQAAAQENIAASAISKRISDLETEIGTPLFYRQQKGVELTPAGDEMLRHARDLQRLLDRIDDHMSDFAQGVRGTVRIAANTSAITQFLPEDLALFVDAHPDMRIDLTELTSPEIVAAVRDGTDDIGIFSGLVPDPDLDVFECRRDTLMVLTPKGHPLGTDGPVAFREFSSHDLVGLQKGSSLQAFIDRKAAEEGLELRTRVEVLSFDGVRRMVEAGLGIAILPLGAVQPYLAASNLRMAPVAEPWAERSLRIAVRDKAALARPIRALLGHLSADDAIL
ncbi:LysR substrate-binding domain-containing protein [Marivita hallyeonensis]|uniref:Transcriptional regulator, LysR family n=1 Tax=Marivita hallyeonensis TaxID=996342 RepID=A0A1M5N390_9RHOB|nr:LysR substrate-binding domain-containing protein [Marivita hallyeonensis]SHG83902.1 transcriptional regulator, LysR family [Marivita hallyeonensis]